MGRIATDATLMRAVGALNAIAINTAPGEGGLTWSGIQALVQGGVHKTRFAIGDQLVVSWTDKTSASEQNWVTYQVPLDIVSFAPVTDNTETEHSNALWLKWHYAPPYGVPFDAPEQLEATEETAAEGIYYYGYDGTNYSRLALDAGDTVPYDSYTKVFKNDINDASAWIVKNGSSSWVLSAIRQWLNSDAATGAWWTARHDCDVAPAEAATRPGLLSGFEADFLSVIKPVKLCTVRNTVTGDGGTDITYDRFFMPSLEQMYGAPPAGTAGIEGAYFPYEKLVTGLAAPSNGSAGDLNAARQIKVISTMQAQSCRLRTAHRTLSNATYTLNNTGYITTSGTNYASYVQPVCVIY